MERTEKRVFLDLNHAFGSNTSNGFKDCVAIFEQDKNEPKVIFPVGKCIAKKSLDRNQMQFVKLQGSGAPYSDNLQSIECICISPKKTHVAVSERLRNQNILIMALYSIKNTDTQKKIFRYVPNAEMKATSFKAFVFSPSEQKFMCCLTGDPDYQLVFIDNSRMRPLAFSNFSLKDVSRIGICPNQSHLISASGKNFFKLYKVQEYAFKPLDEVKKMPKNRNFTEHAWSEKTKILVGTDRGEIFLIGPIGNAYEVKREFLNAFNETSPEIVVTAICPFSKGFILGSDQGKFALWVKKEDNEDNYDDEETVDLVRKWSTSAERKAEVTCIDISSKQDIIVMSFKNNDIATIDMNQILPQTLESVEALKKAKEKQIYFDYLFKGFHNAPISAMDVCLQRPLIATCSRLDNTIRIWNYKNPRCELLRMFSFKNKQNGLDDKTLNPLITLAFHPAGYYLAVGCVDKLRFYHILNTQLRSYRQIVVKGVSQLKFSNGGHLLAAAYPRQKYNIHHISIYNAYTLQQVAHLNDHNNVVTDLLWTRSDEYLISTGLDGAIIEWKTTDWSCKKVVQSNAKYTSVMYNYQNGSILAVGNQMGKNIVREVKWDKDREVPQKVHQMGIKATKLQWLMSHWNYPAILAGTEEGSLKLFNTNLDSLAEQTLNAHCKEIVKVLTSPCGRYVFTAGQDGVLFIYQVSITYKDGTLVRKKAVQGKDLQQLQLNPFVAVVDDFLADIVLVNRGEIDEQLRLQKQLRGTIEQLENKMMVAAQDDQRRFQQQLQQLRASKDRDIDDLKGRLESLKKQKKSLELKSQADLKDLQNKNLKAAQQLQTLYERKLSFQNQKYFQLQQQLIQLRLRHNRQLQTLQTSHSANLQMLKNQFGQSFSKAQQVYTATKQSSQQVQKIFDERVGQIEQQHEQEIRQLNEKHHKDEDRAKKTIAELKDEIGQLRRDKGEALEKQGVLNQAKEELEGVRKGLDRDLEESARRLDEKIQELVERDDMLRSKDRKISELQVLVNDLQKKKHVLSYKAAEMRKSMEPKQAQIEKLKEQIFKLEQEFEQVLQDQQKNLLAMERVEKQKQVLTKALKDQTALTKDKQILLSKISMDILGCIEKKEIDPKFYYREMVGLYHKYVDKLDEKHLSQDPKGVQEMGRQILHLEKSIYQVNKASEKILSRRTDEITKKTKENAELIFDLNEIRKKNKQQQVELKNKDKQIYQLRRDLNLMNSELRKQDKQDEQPNSSLRGTGTPATHLVRSTSLKSSIRKGKVIKGPNYDLQTISTFDRAKMSELVSEIEGLNQRLSLSNNETNRLKVKVRRHLESNACKDQDLEDEVVELSEIH